ncbi:MAG TPA: Uma2 family endonuclease [Isosphaeraceae bacterium]|nr:Uma2 family endonuclease [Isosphaeraceae bacterium]
MSITTATVAPVTPTAPDPTAPSLGSPTGRPRARALIPEQRVVLRGIGWDGFETILRVIGDQPGVRLSYDRGDLEFMSPSVDHEVFKKRFGRMIETLTMELDIPCEGAGSTTWKKQLEDKGLEADECYYLANSVRVAGRRKIDLNVDPPPDLAIEVEISRSALDRMAIYAALRVPEVWRFDGETLIVEVLQDDGTYAPQPTSPSLPFLPLDRLVDWLYAADSASQTTWIRQFRAWVLAELAPRREQG